jgi:transposase
MRCMERAVLKQLLDEGLSLAEIGRRVELHESTVGYWVQRHGLLAYNHGKYAAKGALAKAELETMIAGGMSIAQIAPRVDRSKATVRHWLTDYGLRTRTSEMRRRTADKPNRIVLTCPRHGETNFQHRSEGGYRCLKCRSESVAKRRRRVKQILVEEAGGACWICGYDRCIAALEFHHIDRADKRFSLSERGVARSLARARSEASKCALLCANCHAEVETGLVVLVHGDSARVQSRGSPDLRPG